MKKNLTCILVSAVVMLLFPFIATSVFKSDAGFAIILLMFFVLNPLTAIGVGIFAGRNVKSSWYQPLLLAALFLAGVWAFFAPGETDFFYYVAIYLLVGYLSMIISAIAKRPVAR